MSTNTVQEARAPYGLITQAPAETRVLLHGVKWSTFEALVNDLGDTRACRLAYDNGALEIMAPYYKHEGYNRYFEHLVAAIAREFGLKCKPAGSFLSKREDLKKGIEPDSSFYIQNSKRILGQMKLDLDIDPPPDLMLEVDMSRSSMNKLAICAALGVPEHWRFDGAELEIRLLKDGQYELSDESRAFPGIIFRCEVPRFLQIGFNDDLIAMQDAVRAWIRKERRKNTK